MPEPKRPTGLAELLRTSGLKATRTRLEVLKSLDRAVEPLSAREIHQRASVQKSTDRVTVYRTLASLYKAGLVERARAGSGRAWLYHLVSAPGHNNHPHFHCTGCGSLECLPPETISLDLERLKSIFPARLDHLSINLDGICPKCLAKED